MNNYFNFLKTTAFVFSIILFSGNYKITLAGNSDNQIKSSHSNKVAESIREKKTNSTFKSVNLFSFEKNVNENDNSSSFVSNASIIKIKNELLNKILKNRDENIVFKIPVSDNNFIELELTQSFPASENPLMISIDGNGKKIENYSQGLHYNGIIKGKENSIASISIFKNFVMGIISDENGNYILGSIKNNDNSYSGNYIFYNDNDLNIKNNFKCGIEDNEEKFVKAIKQSENYSKDQNNSDNISTLPVKVYFEADYQMYVDAQQNSSAVFDFILGMFNSVKTIYQNENIPTEVSSIAVWTIPDPYVNLTESYDILSAFGELTQDDFQGNLAHLLSTRNEGFGGIAWIRTLCAEYNPQDYSGRYAFSGIDPGYNNYPVYSWTVNVVTHEMGHNLGSMHTHACVWPFANNFGGVTIKTIDSCYTPEGSCNYNNRPVIGTIMSYCHLWIGNGGGVNLALGFGPLPGDTIRLRYNQAACLFRALNSSEAPATFDLDQNFPNPFNPSTTFRFALPKESFVDLKIYDINGKEVANIISNKYYDKGFYEQSFNSSQYSLSSGIYFYRLVVSSSNSLVTKEFSETKRMILLK